MQDTARTRNRPTFPFYEHPRNICREPFSSTRNRFACTSGGNSANTERIAHEWGYEYFKMDGLWTGTATSLLYDNNEYKEDDNAKAVFHDPYKTPMEGYREGLKLVVDAAGPDIFFLGCNVSQNMRTLAGSYGLLNAMRVGPSHKGP